MTVTKSPPRCAEAIEDYWLYAPSGCPAEDTILAVESPRHIRLSIEKGIEAPTINRNQWNTRSIKVAPCRGSFQVMFTSRIAPITNSRKASSERSRSLIVAVVAEVTGIWDDIVTNRLFIHCWEGEKSLGEPG